MASENNSSEIFTLIVGVGFFETELLSFLSAKRRLKAFDIRENHIAKLSSQFPDVEFIAGDASSFVSWKKININAVSQVIITVRDKDITYETCRIIRQVLKLDIMIIVISYDAYDTSVLDEFSVTVVRPVQMGLDIIASLLDKNVSWPVNIGNRQGEIVEVQVLKNSHLVGVRLKHIRPVSWQISLIYKDGKPQLPTPNTRIQIGDRVIIVGEPKVVKGVVDTLSKGEPNFPLQFGQNIAVLISDQHPELTDEAIYLVKNTMAKKLQLLPMAGRLIKGLAEKLKSENIEIATGRNINHYSETTESQEGMLVMPKKKAFIFGKYYRHFFHNSPSPVLFTEGRKSYSRIVISLNTETPSYAMETGIELAKLLGIPYGIYYVALPEEMRGQRDVEYLNFRKNIVADFEISEGITLDYKVAIGNPIIETIKMLKSLPDDVLLVTAFDPADDISFFNPNVQYLITAKAPCSVLAIPVEDTHA